MVSTSQLEDAARWTEGAAAHPESNGTKAALGTFMRPEKPVDGVGALDVMVRRTDENGMCVYLDDAWRRCTGAASGAGGEAWTTTVCVRDLPGCRAAIAEALGTREPTSIGYRARGVDGSLLHLYEHVTPIIDGDGSLCGLYHVAVDVSPLRTETDQLHHQLERHRTLLSEARHRGRNQLQMIVSMIRMKQRKAATADASSTLDDLARQVEAVALIERDLASTSGMVRLDNYLRALLAPLVAALIERKHNVEVDLAPIELPTDLAVSVALLANEALTNTLKHAFPDGRCGTARLATTVGAETLKLMISDDGVGAPESAFANDDPTSGVGLIRALAAQVANEFVIERATGTTYALSLPLSRERG